MRTRPRSHADETARAAALPARYNASLVEDRAYADTLARTRTAVAEDRITPAPHDATDAPLERGHVLGRYVILERLGAGGMGVVYAAFDPGLDRKVALKLLGRPDEAPEGSSLGPGARLLREAKALARLAHPNVVAVHDAGQVDGRVFVAMEFVPGVTLRHYLSQRTLHWREILALFVAAGRGLQAAHAAGLVHRDFKPENVLVGDDGRVRVLDFGLARASESEESGVLEQVLKASRDTPPVRERATDASGTDFAMNSMVSVDSRLTRVGALIGTPAYMAPEQYMGLPTSASSDQFSFNYTLTFKGGRGDPFQGLSARNSYKPWTIPHPASPQERPPGHHEPGESQETRGSHGRDEILVHQHTRVGLSTMPHKKPSQSAAAGPWSKQGAAAWR